MLSAFDDVRLPEDIERGVIGGPEFRTTINRLINAREQRNSEWDYPLFSTNIGYGVQKREDLEAIYAFFHARLGRARGFRFRNWLDYKVTAEPVGTIVGNPLQRQLIRTFADDVNPQIRLITRPVASTLKVYKDMVLTTDYVLGEKGVLTFGTDPGMNVLATFEFDLPVRFDTDQLQVRLTTQFAGDAPSIPIVELRE